KQGDAEPSQCSHLRCASPWRIPLVVPLPAITWITARTKTAQLAQHLYPDVQQLSIGGSTQVAERTNRLDPLRVLNMLKPRGSALNAAAVKSQHIDRRRVSNRSDFWVRSVFSLKFRPAGLRERFACSMIWRTRS